MDFRRKTHALVIGLGAAATHTYMRELAISTGAIAAVLLKVVADLILVELVDEVAAKLVWKFHKVVEVLDTRGRA